MLLLSVLSAALGAENAPATGPQPNRFVFVVNTSGAMSGRENNTALVVAELIERGLGGTMEPGDVFSVWNYSDHMQTTGIVNRAWTPAARRPISNQAFLYLSKARWSGKPNLLQALIKIMEVVRQSEHAYIYLVNSGEETFGGTPYDAAINEAWRKNAQKLREMKAVCVTALVAEKGEIVDWAVGMALPFQPVTQLARKPAPAAAPPIVKAPTNAVPPITIRTNAPTLTVVTTNAPPAPKAVPLTNDLPKVIKPLETTQNTNAVATAKLETKPPKLEPAQAEPPKTNAVQVAKRPKGKGGKKKTSAPPVTEPKQQATSPPTAPSVSPKPAETAIPTQTAKWPPLSSPAKAAASTNVVWMQPAVPPIIKPPELPPVEFRPVPTPPELEPMTQAIAQVAPPPPPITSQIPAIRATQSNHLVITPTAAPPAAAEPPRSTNHPAAPTLALGATPYERNPILLLIAGLAMLAAAGWISYVWYRKSQATTGRSLITQSMNIERSQLADAANTQRDRKP
jgi:hypothetical protein